MNFDLHVTPEETSKPLGDLPPEHRGSDARRPGADLGDCTRVHRVDSAMRLAELCRQQYHSVIASVMDNNNCQVEIR